MSMLTLWIVLAHLTGTVTSLQDHHAANDRAAMVMGFDQDKTAHHFYLYADGGTIDVTANDQADTANITAVRSHLPHISQMFADGNFNAPMLVHDSTNVPGTAALTTLKDRLTYTYRETPGGGRVDIRSSDPAALAALHAFLAYQIQEHHTGDPRTVTVRP